MSVYRQSSVLGRRVRWNMNNESWVAFNNVVGQWPLGGSTWVGRTMDFQGYWVLQSTTWSFIFATSTPNPLSHLRIESYVTFTVIQNKYYGTSYLNLWNKSGIFLFLTNSNDYLKFFKHIVVNYLQVWQIYYNYGI